MKRMVSFLLIMTVLFLSACSNNGGGESGSKANKIAEHAADNSRKSKSKLQEKLAGSSEAKQGQSSVKVKSSGRMIIYTVELDLIIDDFQKVRESIEELVRKANGYIVQSVVHNEKNQLKRGRLTVRIPQGDFRSFLEATTSLAKEVVSRSVRGQDVTKEYVDLEARLKAKKMVKQRLEAILKKAKKTSDLLEIYKEIERVQTDIESIKGKMQYLENKSSLATVHINLREEKVVVPEVGEQDLNTWEKTKQKFVASINGLLNFFSSLFVWLFGYSPILILLGGIGLLAWILWKRKGSD